MSLQHELRGALESWGVAPAGGLTMDSPLIDGAMLDSLALFNLTLWVEEQIGSPIDPATFNLRTEWRSPASILRFIAERTAKSDCLG